MKGHFSTSHPKAITAPPFHWDLQCIFLFMKFIFPLTTWCHTAKKSNYTPEMNEQIAVWTWKQAIASSSILYCNVLSAGWSYFSRGHSISVRLIEKHHFSSFGLLQTVSVWITALTINHEVGVHVDQLCNVPSESQHYWLQPNNQFSFRFIHSFQLSCQHLFSPLRVPTHTTCQHSIYCNKKWCQKS